MFAFKLLTPERAIEVNADLAELTLPAERGELNILPGHIPLVTSLRPGTLSYKLVNGKEMKYSIAWGYCQVTFEGVTVLADFVKSAQEIDQASVTDQLVEAEKRLSTESLSDEEYNKLLEHMQWYRNQLEFLNQNK